MHTLDTDRSAATHHRGHSYYGNTCPDRCSAAARWAARRLITPRLFLAAARAEPRIDDIAARLSVTPADVRCYLESLSLDEFRIMRRLVGHPVT